MNKLLKLLGSKSAIDNIIADSKKGTEEEPYVHELFGHKIIWTEKPVYEEGELISEGIDSGNRQLDIMLHGDNHDINLHGAEVLDLDVEGNTRVIGYSYINNK